jgi:GT2 family glycosyltransferase
MVAADLSVIIPTRNRGQKLRLTLEALAKQTESGFETIVVLDGIDQPAPEFAAVHVLDQAQAGPGVARNRGVAASNRPLVLFLNDDMVPRPDLVARHMSQHRRHGSSRVAVLGRVVWHTSVPRDRLHGWLGWSGALFDFPTGEGLGGDDAGWTRFYSCNVSMRRELFVDTGGFDPDFRFDYEDLDLGYRLGQRGMRLLYEPQAVTEHLHTYDWPAVIRRYQSRASAERLMMAKHDWFAPWFYNQLSAAQSQRSVSRLWALAAQRVPDRPARLQLEVRRRADRYYRQRLAPAFLAAWAGAGYGADPEPAGALPRPDRGGAAATSRNIST